MTARYNAASVKVIQKRCRNGKFQPITEFNRRVGEAALLVQRVGGRKLQFPIALPAYLERGNALARLGGRDLNVVVDGPELTTRPWRSGVA